MGDWSGEAAQTTMQSEFVRRNPLALASSLAPSQQAAITFFWFSPPCPPWFTL
jgi:hypothetical protein